MKIRHKRQISSSSLLSPIAIVAWLLTLLTGCELIDVPESPAEKPVFEMSLQGSPDIGLTHWKAGEDSVVITPRYSWTNDNYLVYHVRFERSGCKGKCNESIEFLLTSKALYKKRLNYSFERDFTTGPRPYAWDFDPTQVQLVLRSNDSPKSSLLRERYLLNDSVIVAWRRIHPSPIRIQAHLPNPKRFTLCHEIAHEKSRKYQLRVCIPVYYRKRKFIPSRLMGNFLFSSLSRDSITIQAAIRGAQGPLKYTWFDGTTTDSAERSFHLQDLLPKHIYVNAVDLSTDDEIRLELLFDNILLLRDLITITNQQAEAIHFRIDDIRPMTNPHKIEPNSIEIRYRRGKNNIFSTRLYRQSPKAFFDVVSISDYEDPIDGRKYKKVKVRFGCTLFHKTRNKTLRIPSAEAVLAIDYPR